MNKKNNFIAHGYYIISNCFTLLIQISDCGEAGRIKYHDDKITKWCKISNGILSPSYHKISLNEVVKIN